MSKPFLSDEEIYSGLEDLLEFFCEQIPRYKSHFSDEASEQAQWDLQRRPLFQEHFKKLQASGYDEWTAREFLFSGYSRLFQAEAIQKMHNKGYNKLTASTLYDVCLNYLRENKVLDHDQLRIPLDIIPFDGLTPDTKTDWCMKMFSKNEKYIKARYELSIRAPEMPIPNSVGYNPFDRMPKIYFGGK